ncbi:hypothetical protein HID58_079653 [Brassica napus]|uniref:Uncharacterized protein n=1 Tax=Brassica napus TaxID=3708 RepID=A0ABQ7Y2L9_BRANA|nr:hypothetical protein HID58_079653 [Brassica napus]
MSDLILVKINCFHPGMFKNEEDGKLNYVNGFLEQLEVDGDAKFSVEKIWYMLTYEDILEKKDLVENREENKRKMNANGRSYRELDVFTESKVVTVIEVDNNERAEQHAVYGDEIVEQQALDDDEIDVEQQDDTYDGDQEVEKSEDEYQDTNEFDNEDDIDKKIEEDLSMFRNENYEDEIPDKDTRRNVIFDRWDKTKIGANAMVNMKATTQGSVLIRYTVIAFVGDEIDAEQQALDSDEIDVEQQDDTYDGDQEVEKSEDEYQDTNEFDNEDDTDKKFEEDLSMFRNENYEDEIRNKDTFYSGENFNKQVIKYILKTRRNVIFDRWDKTKIGAQCNSKYEGYNSRKCPHEAFVGGEIDAEQQALDGDEIDVEKQDDTYDGDQEVEKSEDEYQDTNEFDDEDDTDKKFEEDLSMFRNEIYEDEIRNKDVIYPDIEQSSDDEEEQTERMAKRGGGIRWRF